MNFSLRIWFCTECWNFWYKIQYRMYYVCNDQCIEVRASLHRSATGTHLSPACTFMTMCLSCLHVCLSGVHPSSDGPAGHQWATVLPQLLAHFRPPTYRSKHQGMEYSILSDIIVARQRELYIVCASSSIITHTLNCIPYAFSVHYRWVELGWTRRTGLGYDMHTTSSGCQATHKN